MLNVLGDLYAQAERHGPIKSESSILPALLDFAQNKHSLDDRKLLLEHTITFLARNPDDRLARKVKPEVVKLFYNDLTHPPSTFVGNKYAWRSADGRGNNIYIPEMGQAGQPYVRSVQQTHPLPTNSLPDAGLLFDTLLKRDGFVKHPAGVSSFMFAFGTLIVHSVFRTSRADPSINETSSYVDLSPLYGHNQEAQDKVRIRDGRGLLHPDAFSEDRFLFLPPAVCVLLVLFNRNHNFIARKLFTLNERGTYVDPATLSMGDPRKFEQLRAQEEEIFQTARLINVGWFASCIFADYVSSLLGLVREGNSWTLNPFEEMRKSDHSLFERGKGNACSVEFNCLYRWHAVISAEDEKWSEATFAHVFNGKDPATITAADMKLVGQKLASMPEVQQWTFGGLKRQEDGTFRDADLARVLHEATENPAGAFRARGTPAVMRLHEVMGIEQNRKWGVCSMNDFRRYLGLKPFDTFLEWNSNPEIANAAEKLYGDIERLELYVGLQAEEAKPVVGGAGLCSGYTISRAILSDAIALTRGDRHFTADFTPYNLTAWGYADCQRDPNGAGCGSMFGRLFLRTLPEHFTANSAYTWFPMMTPPVMKTHLKNLGQVHKYEFVRPKASGSTHIVNKYSEVVGILDDTASYTMPYAARAATVVNGSGFYTASTDADRSKRDHRAILGAIVRPPGAIDEIGAFFHAVTRKLITANSYRMSSSETVAVDIVRDVLNYVPLYWAAGEVAGIPIKKDKTSVGAYTPEELYNILCDIYTFIFLECETSKQLTTQDKVKSDIEALLLHITNHLTTTKSHLITGAIQTASWIFFGRDGNKGPDLPTRLQELGYPPEHLANSVLAFLLSSTVELSLSLTNMVNLYLSNGEEVGLSSSHVKAWSTHKVEGFVDEALRIDPPFQGVYRASSTDSMTRVFVDIAAANMDGRVFRDPGTVILSRSTTVPAIEGDGASRWLGKELTRKIMSEVLRATAGFGNIRRAPGISGKLNRFIDDASPLVRNAYLDKKQHISPWPTGLVVQYTHRRED